MAYTTINKPSLQFNTLTYAGDGTSPRSVTGVGFQPDFVWIRNRTQAGDSGLYDSIRGAGNNKDLVSETTGAEGAGGGDGYGYLSAFNSDGFSLTAGTVGSDITNKSGSNYVTWNWKANGSGSSNNSGTITSTVSANTTSGFSIVTYTGNGTSGATVGHGLGVAPSMIIEKGRSVTDDWLIYHKSLGATYGLALNNTTAAATSTGYWNDTAPTSSVFSIGNNGKVNTSGGTHVAYCFAEVKGYSKFGSYTGNGNADGTFVYTGFKPAFVIMKRSDSADNWLMKDSVRDSYNLANKRLYPNQNAGEDTSVNGSIDILSNGFKQRGSDTLTNGSGGTYIYMAFAEQPLVGTNNVPATAR